MGFDFIFIGKDLDTIFFQYGSPKDLEIGSAIASHQFLSRLDESEFVHLTTNEKYTCIVQRNGIYFILNVIFPTFTHSSSLSDIFTFFKTSNTSKTECLSDYFLEKDIENTLDSVVQIYAHIGNPHTCILNNEIMELFIDSSIKLESVLSPKLQKLGCDIYWTPRFHKSKANILPLMFLDQNLTATNNIPQSVVKYLFHLINSDGIDLPSKLTAFKRPMQCRSNFISDMPLDNHYYVFNSQIVDEKRTCIWIPIPFMVVVFTVATRENLSEILQEVESDISLVQQLCNCHNSVLTSFLPKSKENKKKMQYCLYPNTTSYLYGKYATYYIQPDTFDQTICKINMNIAHVVAKLVRRYLLSFQDSSHLMIIAKPRSSRILREKKLGSSSTELMNFWIIHKKKSLALVFGSTNSVIRSCPSGVNLDNMPISQLDLSLVEALSFLKSFERSFIQ